jgi:hypothetical protein
METVAHSQYSLGGAPEHVGLLELVHNSSTVRFYNAFSVVVRLCVLQTQMLHEAVEPRLTVPSTPQFSQVTRTPTLLERMLGSKPKRAFLGKENEYVQ